MAKWLLHLDNDCLVNWWTEKALMSCQIIVNLLSKMIILALKVSAGAGEIQSNICWLHPGSHWPHDAMSGAGTGAGHWTGCQQADTCTLLISNFQTVSDISSHNVWHGMCHCDLCHYYQCFLQYCNISYTVCSLGMIM